MTNVALKLDLDVATFNKLEVGDWFIFKDNVYIRLPDKPDDNAYDVVGKQRAFIFSGSPVFPIKEVNIGVK